MTASDAASHLHAADHRSPITLNLTARLLVNWRMDVFRTIVFRDGIGIACTADEATLETFPCHVNGLRDTI